MNPIIDFETIDTPVFLIQVTWPSLARGTLTPPKTLLFPITPTVTLGPLLRSCLLVESYKY